MLMIDALAVFAEYALQELGLPLDEAWAASAYTVQDVLRGPHWERFQQWPADRRCGGGSGPPLLSADRLPCTMRRVFDLEGVRLTKAQAAGLGVAMMMPGSTMIAMSSVGAALLVKKAQEHKSLLAAGAGAGASARWQVVQAGAGPYASGSPSWPRQGIPAQVVGTAAVAGRAAQCRWRSGQRRIGARGRRKRLRCGRCRGSAGAVWRHQAGEVWRRRMAAQVA